MYNAIHFIILTRKHIWQDIWNYKKNDLLFLFCYLYIYYLIFWSLWTLNKTKQKNTDDSQVDIILKKKHYNDCFCVTNYPFTAICTNSTTFIKGGKDILIIFLITNEIWFLIIWHKLMYTNLSSHQGIPWDNNFFRHLFAKTIYFSPLNYFFRQVTNIFFV